METAEITRRCPKRRAIQQGGDLSKVPQSTRERQRRERLFIPGTHARDTGGGGGGSGGVTPRSVSDVFLLFVMVSDGSGGSDGF